MPEQLGQPVTQTTREWIDLKLQNLRSELRLLILLAVVMNQTLFRLNLGAGISAAAGGVGIAAIVLKIILIR